MLTLSASNTYSGATAVSAGTLQVASGVALGFGASYGQNVAMRRTTAKTGMLDIDGATLNEPLTLNGGVLVNSNTATAATLDSGVAGLTFTGAGSGFPGPR